ncbi:MAG: DUF2516 family protein [Candidatus Nanopelagicales bacterium]
MLGTVMFVVNLLIIAMVVWALIDCIVRPAAAFPAVDRQTKVAWITFLGIGTAIVIFFGAISLLGMLGVVVAVFYLVDVRTKVLEITRR